MGMIQKIDLYTISNSLSFSAGLTSLLKQNNEIYLHDCFRSLNSALNYFYIDSTSLKNNKVVFIEDLSLDKAETVDFLKSYCGDFKLEEIKTIVYTDSVNPEYLHGLISSNVMSILHDHETPVMDSLLLLKEEQSQRIIQTHLNSTNTVPAWEKVNEKLIRIIRLVNSGCYCYDSIVIDSITLRGFNWAMRETNNDKLSQGLMSFKSELSEAVDKMNLLSKREREILLKIAEGKKNYKIADEFHVSADTISQHKAHILIKLGLKSTQSLSVLALLLLNGLLS